MTLRESSVRSSWRGPTETARATSALKDSISVPGIGRDAPETVETLVERLAAHLDQPVGGEDGITRPESATAELRMASGAYSSPAGAASKTCGLVPAAGACQHQS